MKHFMVMAMALGAALAGCKKDEAKDEAPKADPAAKKDDPAAKSADPAAASKTDPAAAAKTDPAAATKPADPAAAVQVDPAAKAEFDKVSEQALAMCKKDMEAIAKTDIVKSDKFVAALAHPSIKTAEFPDSYNKKGIYPFVGTSAAVVQWYDDNEFSVVVTSDGTDPCKVKPDDSLITEKGNPAVRIKVLGNKPAMYSLWDPGSGWNRAELWYAAKYADAPTEVESVGHGAQGYFDVQMVEKGKGATIVVHSCEDQKGELSAFGGNLEHRYFAVGKVDATWCPGT